MKYRGGKWFVCAALLLGMMAGARAQMVEGRDIPGFNETFGLTKSETAFTAALVSCNALGNILYPNEQAAFVVQIVNKTAVPIDAKAHFEVVAYGTKGRPNDIWTPQMFKMSTPVRVPVSVKIAANGYADYTIAPKIPAAFGAYALVLDMGSAGRQFVTSVGRTFAADTKRIQYPKFCLDDIDPTLLKRLGVQAVRHGIGYKPTTDPDFPQWYANETRKLKEFQDANIAVLFMVMGGEFYGPTQPTGRPRPWLNSDGVLQDTKFDLAWLPSYDDDFQKYVHRFTSEYGWPRGPINAIELWNEPWEGISISGWGADMPRYRELYNRMWAGTEDARQHDGVDLLVGGCDSTSNALDKLFADGSDDYLSKFDFCAIHYQGLSPGSNIKQWRNRQNPRGRVQIWDTESWVANTDDRVAALVASNRAAGYDRAMGVFGGNIAHTEDRDIRTADGKGKHVHNVIAWSVAPAIGAAQHFLGERDFERILFQNGLPWIMLFKGLNGNVEDGTAVIVGDLGEEDGADNLPFRTARGFAERRHKAELKARLATLPADAPAKERTALLTALNTAETLSGATMTLAASGRYGLFDFYGNPVPAKGGKIVVPLDGRGFFLRGDGRPGSWAKLVEAIQHGRVEGIEPLAMIAHDMTGRIENHPTLRLSLTNVLNRTVKGKLSVKLGDLTLESVPGLTFAANETREIAVKITGGAAAANNTYPLTVTFDAGKDGSVSHSEAMHCTVIPRRTITIDGDLSDWKDVPPLPVTSPETVAPSLTEAAYFPFKNFDAGVTTGFATGYLAYDDAYFYFAAKVADSTPDAGMPRFETRSDDEFFYPDVAKVHEGDGIAGRSDNPNLKDVRWPDGVRHYSYRKDPELPSGNFPNHDNVQIAFNVLPDDAKPWTRTLPGIMPGFISYKDTDYEYALNPVAAKYGGGTEIWRLEVPGMPHKHFYPRQGKSPLDGPVKEGKLVIQRDGNTRLVECALPWSELPEVRKRLDAGQTIKFSFRVNDSSNVGCMELSRGRSVARRNGSFHADWLEHWANEIEFGFEK